MKTNKNIILVLALILGLCGLNLQAQSIADNEIDKNIEILFPKDYFKNMVLPLIPQITQGVELKSEADRAAFNKILDKMVINYCNNIESALQKSVKANFSAQEIAEWVKYQQSPLGRKTTAWMNNNMQPLVLEAMKEPLNQAMREVNAFVASESKQ